MIISLVMFCETRTHNYFTILLQSLNTAISNSNKYIFFGLESIVTNNDSLILHLTLCSLNCGKNVTSSIWFFCGNYIWNFSRCFFFGYKILVDVFEHTSNFITFHLYIIFLLSFVGFKIFIKNNIWITFNRNALVIIIFLIIKRLSSWQFGPYKIKVKVYF